METRRRHTAKEMLGRMALLTLPASFLFGAVAVVVGSVLAWGAGRHVEQPDWTPTFAGLSFAIPGLLISGFCFKEAFRRTRYRFTTSALQLASGVLFLLLGSAFEVALALRLPDPDTYDTLRHPDGTFTSPFEFLAVTLLGMVLVCGVIAATAYVYARAITADVPTRHDRRADEVDAMGEILSGRQQL